MTVIAVVGATGVVGRHCVEALVAGMPDATIIAGARRPAELGPSIARWRERHGDGGCVVAREVDIDSAGSQDFADADVVVNCAGPSYRVSARLAECVAPVADYVDVGGDAALIAHLGPVFGGCGRRAVVGAGVQPGLVGLVMRAVLARGGIGSIEGWVGGSQRMSSGGFEEYLAAVEARTGHPRTRLVAGELVPAESAVLPPSWPGTARAHPMIDEEAVVAAQDLGVRDMRWSTVTDPPGVESVLGRVMAGEMGIDAAIGALDALMCGRRPYFRIDVQTLVDDVSGVRVVVDCEDSAAVTGGVAAVCAARIQRFDPGAAWMSCVADPVDFLDLVAGRVPARVVWPSMATGVEEGVL